MKVDVLTLEQAYDRLTGRYGLLPVGLGAVGSMSITGPVYEAVVCDYRRLPGYTVDYAISVYGQRGAGQLIERFNIARGG